MNAPLISLIVPMFNVEKYVSRCIACIKNQTYCNLEVILVDDGSTDNTYEICKREIEEVESIRLIHTENHGVSAARNIGIGHAKGEYVAFADADDYFFEDYIEFMVNIARKYNADIAMCDYIKISEKNLEKYLHLKQNEIETKKYDSKEALRNVSYRKELSGAAPGKLIKSQIAKKCLWNVDIAYYEDYLYMCDVIEKSENVYFNATPKYLYLQCKGSATHCYDSDKCIKSWKILIKKLMEKENSYPQVYSAFQSKALAISLDMMKKIYGNGYDESEIRGFIKENSLGVAKDNQCKMLKRLLALAAYINIDMSICIGKFLLKLLSCLGKEM